jgi:hypothetical protein
MEYASPVLQSRTIEVEMVDPALPELNAESRGKTADLKWEAG